MTIAGASLIGATILASAFISGVFGLAGGMVLLGVLLVFFDVPTSMVLFSILQMAGNLWRALLYRRYVIWTIVLSYVLGSVSAFVLLRFVSFVPGKAMVYVLIGLLPYVVEAIPLAWKPNIEWRGVPYFSGLVTAAIQLIAGNGGLFLDIFFQKSRLDRKTTVATKAVAHTFTHAMRIAYFAPFWTIDALPSWGYAGGIALAIAGTSLASLLLDRMTDEGFRIWTKRIIFAISTTFLLRALWLILQG
jgi:uncharacterized membrane protein YfcA